MLTYTTRDFGQPFGEFTASITDSPKGPALAGLAFGTTQDTTDMPENHAHLAERIWEKLEDYFAGQGLDTADIPLAMHAPDFTQRVWQHMQQIPFGHTETYGSIAAQLSNPRASRAVGNACRTNPIPIFVPCHRVLDAAGRLHGYAGVLPLKRARLACENITTSD